MIFWILNLTLTQKWSSNVEAQCGLGSWMMSKGELSFHRPCFDYDLELVQIVRYRLDVNNYSHRFPSAFKYVNTFKIRQN